MASSPTALAESLDDAVTKRRSVNRQASSGLEGDGSHGKHQHSSIRGIDEGIAPIRSKSFDDLEETGKPLGIVKTQTSLISSSSSSYWERSFRSQSHGGSERRSGQEYSESYTRSSLAASASVRRSRNFSRSSSPRPPSLHGQKSIQLNSLARPQFQSFQADYSDSFGREIVKQARTRMELFANSLNVDQIHFRESSARSSAISDVTHSQEFSYRMFDNSQSNHLQNPYNQRFEKSLESIQSALMGSQETTEDGHMQSKVSSDHSASSVHQNEAKNKCSTITVQDLNAGDGASTSSELAAVRHDNLVSQQCQSSGHSMKSSSGHETLGTDTAHCSNHQQQFHLDHTPPVERIASNLSSDKRSNINRTESDGSLQEENSLKSFQSNSGEDIMERVMQRSSSKNSRTSNDSSFRSSSKRVRSIEKHILEGHPTDENLDTTTNLTGEDSNETESSSSKHTKNIPQYDIQQNRSSSENEADTDLKGGLHISSDTVVLPKQDDDMYTEPLKEEGQHNPKHFGQRSMSTGDRFHNSFLHPVEEENELQNPKKYKRSRSTGDEPKLRLSLELSTAEIPSSEITRRGESFLSKPKKDMTMGIMQPGAYNEVGRAFGERPAWAPGTLQSRSIFTDNIARDQQGCINSNMQESFSHDVHFGSASSSETGRNFGRGSSADYSVSRSASCDSIDPLDDPLDDQDDEEQNSTRCNSFSEAAQMNRSNDNLLDPLNDEQSQLLDHNQVVPTVLTAGISSITTHSIATADYSTETNFQVRLGLRNQSNQITETSSFVSNVSRDDVPQQKEVCSTSQFCRWLLITCCLFTAVSIILPMALVVGDNEPVEAQNDCILEKSNKSSILQECRCYNRISRVDSDTLSSFNILSTIHNAIGISNLSSEELVSCDNAGAIAGLEMVRMNSTSIDHFVLLVLYQKLGGMNWINQEGWFTDIPVCEWFGIRCRGDDEVVGLNLTKNNIVGELPIELTWLTSLEMIVVSLNDYLEGTIHSEMKRLQNLTDLRLGDTGLQGSIPSELGDMSRLLYLDMSYTSVNSTLPTEIGTLFNMEYFDVSGTFLSGTLPTELLKLTKIRTLFASNCLITGTILSEIGSMYTLTDLDLASNRFDFSTLPSGIWMLTNLVSLELSEASLIGPITFESLSQPSNLQRLTLGGNGLTGTVPTEIGLLTNLKTASLNGNLLGGVLPSEIGSCGNLTTLDLNNCELTGLLPTELAQLTFLNHLYLHGNRNLKGNLEDFCSSLDDFIPFKQRDSHAYKVDASSVVCSCCDYELSHNK